MTVETDLKQVARMAETAVDMAAAGQQASMALLLAEMRALVSLMPGHAPALSEGTEIDEARRRVAEAEVEASFDNMPV